MEIKRFFKRVGSAIERQVKKSQINSKRREEIRLVKGTYLGKLSKRELVQIYKGSALSPDADVKERLERMLGVPSSDDTKERINPHKISRYELINILLSQLSSKQIREALTKLGKHKLAEDFWSEIENVNKKYDRMLLEIEGKIEETAGDKILREVVNEIITHMRELYAISFKPKNERDFHRQIEPFLKGRAFELEKSLGGLGEINLRTEYSLPSKERIDLLISVGGIRIGVEVKYDLKEKPKLHRLLGQIDRYIDHVDSLVVVSYSSLDTYAIREIKKKEEEKGKPISIVTPDKTVV